VGQEVVSRVEHRGLARKRIIGVRLDGPVPEIGAAIHAGEIAIGTMGSSFGKTGLANAGLAMLRLDRAEEARAAGVGLVGSFHDFVRTPSDEVLEGAVSLAEAAGVDVVKVATFLNSAEDLGRLVAFAGRARRLRVSVMGMGSLGPVSRLVLAKCGSLLNYGYLGAESNAPGQWPARRLKAVLAELQ
jgi:hypothetical protein